VDLTTANQQLLGQQLAAIQQLDTSIDAELQARKQQLLHQIRQQLQSQALQGQQQQYQQLFAALIDPAVTAEQLPAVYRLLFNRQNDTLSRSDLTLAMEWAAGSASPAPELQRRQQVQMLLLSEKLNQGEAVNLTQLLGRWLSHGPVTAEEQPLLQRVQQLFLAHRHG
jgi:FKBP-type peptidyl-prolyl cis-trans isomerase (trigger factor)